MPLAGQRRQQRTVAVILLVDLGPAGAAYLLLEYEEPCPVEELLGRRGEPRSSRNRPAARARP